MCRDGEAAWVHRLDSEKAGFWVYGRVHTFDVEIAMCDRCDPLYWAGDDEALVALNWRFDQSSEADIDELIRKPLAVMRRADLGPVPLDDTLPPGAAPLRAAGFTPIEYLTGNDHVAGAWPPAHRRSVPDTRWLREPGDDDAMWFVRSPWPDMSLRHVVDLMWGWILRQEFEQGRNPSREREAALMSEFLGHDREWALSFAASLEGS